MTQAMQSTILMPDLVQIPDDDVPSEREVVSDIDDADTVTAPSASPADIALVIPDTEQEDIQEWPRDILAARREHAAAVLAAARAKLQEPTSSVHKNPQGWEEEGILFPHEGIRFLMQELSEAVNVMDPMPAWKWQNLATWYQEYFYDVVHHHHDAEEQLYLPWIQTHVSVPTKITTDHPELMQAMDELRDMIHTGALLPVDERLVHLSKLRLRVADFVFDMKEHLAEEEEIIPCLLRQAGFTQEEEGVVVGQIIQSMGLDGNKRALPAMLHAYSCWAGADKAETFVEEKLPLPIQLLYKYSWLNDFEQRHKGLLASLAEGMDTNPFESNCLWFGNMVFVHMMKP